MLDALLKIIPVILIFLIGYLLKTKKFFRPEDADLFLKLNFLVGAPALVLLSISQIKLDLNLIFIPVIAILIVLATFVVSSFVGKKILRLDDKSLGVFFLGTMIINTGFTFPFIIAAFGPEGLARIVLFDFGSELIGLTLAYYLGIKHGKNSQGTLKNITKVFTSPLFIALILGGLINFLGLKLPFIVSDTLNTLGNLLVPLVMLSLGIRFSPKLTNLLPVFSGVGIRMFFGLFVGILLSLIFKLDGLSRIVTIITSASPVGYMTLTFSSLEGLNKEYAASLVSFSVLIALALIPILIIATSNFR